MIAARTVAALQAAKRAGVKLGSSRPGHWRGREHLRAKGQQAATAVAAAKRRELRADTYAAALPIATKLAADGCSLHQIADTLNTQGITTSRGAVWRAEQVRRMLDAGKRATA